MLPVLSVPTSERNVQLFLFLCSCSCSCVVVLNPIQLFLIPFSCSYSYAVVFIPVQLFLFLCSCSYSCWDKSPFYYVITDPSSQCLFFVACFVLFLKLDIVFDISDPITKSCFCPNSENFCF
jgi:predicted CDP-diglyceride synthetase/phosphatidate cytidylyltransferase